jgi:L-ascorbate metabolism protein UlaG (beta-lactamase superfamily)
MHISWLGLSALKIETKDAVLVTDPFAPTLAKKPLRAKADVVTISIADDPARNTLSGIQGEPFVIDHPGEFEVKGIFIQGISVSENSGRGKAQKEMETHKHVATRPADDHPVTVFTFDVEDMRLAHLGGLPTRPTGEAIERLNGVDVLFIPVGGAGTLDADAAAAVVNDIEPRMVIPIHFASDGGTVDPKLASVSAFLKEMGASTVKPIDRLLVKKRDLPGEEETRVVILSA